MRDVGTRSSSNYCRPMLKKLGLIFLGIAAGIVFVVSCGLGENADADSTCSGQWLVTRYELVGFPEVEEKVPVNGDVELRQFLMPTGYEPFGNSEFGILLRRCV